MSMRRVCGVDEAGRGPLAGPVCAAAVILDPQRVIPGLADSKKLSEKKRDQLAMAIRRDALAWQVAWASVAEIDALNILQATHLAMSRAVAGLAPAPDEVWVDGNTLPAWHWPARAIIGGDASVAEISAASILAKTARDALMHTLDVEYPGYDFARHKGYGTAAHLAALHRLGPCALHRQSFAPVAQVRAQIGLRGI
jgi:ribonuclease HII